MASSECCNDVIVLNLCFADECAQHDPPIGNIPKLINMACINYNYGKITYSATTVIAWADLTLVKGSESQELEPKTFETNGIVIFQYSTPSLPSPSYTTLFAGVEGASS